MWRKMTRVDRIRWGPRVVRCVVDVCWVSCDVLICCCDVMSKNDNDDGWIAPLGWCGLASLMGRSVGFCLEWGQWCKLRGEDQVVGSNC